SRSGRASGCSSALNTSGSRSRMRPRITRSPSRRSGPSDPINTRPTDMLAIIALLLVAVSPSPSRPNAPAAPVKVVTSLTTYAAIAVEIVGDRGKVSSIAVGDENADYFAAREKNFEDRMYRALFGDELVKLIGGETLADLDRQGKLFNFLGQQQYQGAPLIGRLGGWLKQGMPFRGKLVACYHKEWDYFSREFQVTCFDYIEPKPGIPPTPRHVQEIITAM